MPTRLTILNCGRNGTGFSSMISLFHHKNEESSYNILINAGDSTQKFCNEYKIKLRKVIAVFFSSLAPHNVAGLPAILLSLSDLGIKSLKIIGQIGVRSLLESMRVFTNRRYPELEIFEITNQSQIHELNFQTLIGSFQFYIYPLKISGYENILAGLSMYVTIQEQSSITSIACLGYSQSYQIIPNLDELCNNVKVSNNMCVMFVPLQVGGGSSIEESHSERLKSYFQIISEKYNICGILIDLQLINSVIEFRQAQIHLDQRENREKLQTNIIISSKSSTLNDCNINSTLPIPSPFHQILEKKEFIKELKLRDEENNQDNSLHLLNSTSPTYYGWNETLTEVFEVGTLIIAQPFQSFEFDNYRQNLQKYVKITSVINQFENIVQIIQENHQENITTNLQQLSSPIESIAPIETIVNTVCHEILITHEQNNINNNINEEIEKKEIKNQEIINNNEIGENYSTAQHLRSSLRKRRLNETSKASSCLSLSSLESNEVSTSLELKSEILNDNSQIKNENISILFLGTGCAIPSCHRSNSAILFQLKDPIQLNLTSTILLDVGESCLAQLYIACQGNTLKMRNVLNNISIIWISHHHADHHSGLAHLLEEIFKIKQNTNNENNTNNTNNHRILIIAPVSVIAYHQYLMCIGGYDEIVDFIPIEKTTTGRNFDAIIQTKILTLSKGLIQKLQSIRVEHCKDSFGVIIFGKTREKYVYSGDCRPTEMLINFGQNCDLLIHEATFDDNLIIQAQNKRHSTISEAREVGIKMNSKLTILTHFSQRYPQIHPSQIESDTIKLAYDFLRISL